MTSAPVSSSPTPTLTAVPPQVTPSDTPTPRPPTSTPSPSPTPTNPPIIFLGTPVPAPVAAGDVASGDFGTRPPAGGAEGTAAQVETAPLDLILAGRDQPQLALLQGDGHGGFSPAAQLTLAGAAGGLSAVAVVDLTGDGNLDVVASNPGAKAIVSAIGNGQHGLQEGVSTRIDVVPGRLVVLDVSRDSVPDLIVGTQSGVLILRGSGDGGFAVLSRIEIGAPVVDVATAGNAGGAGARFVAAVPQDNAIQVYKNDGTGEFQVHQSLPGSEPVAIVAGDFTGDEYADLLVANAGDHSLSFFPGSATGFGSGRTVATGLKATRLARTDLSGDGRADVVALDQAGAMLRALLGNGQGGFQLAATEQVGAPPVPGLTVADFNGDRLPDLVLSLPVTQDIVIAVTTGPPPVRPGDLNRDSTVDERDGELLVRELYDGDGAEAASTAGGTLASGAEADVNGDGSVSAGDLPGLALY